MGQTKPLTGLCVACGPWDIGI